MKQMKKRTLSILMALTLGITLAGCGSAGSSSDNTKTAQPEGSAAAETKADDLLSQKPDKTVKLRVGASPTPHAEILNSVKEDLLKTYNVDLEVKEYSDYVIPNTAVEEGEDDANYFQHTPYLDTFNEDNGTHLVSVAKIHYEPFGVYSNTLKSLDELKDGASIAVPNDGSNEARALYLLEQEGVITLDHNAGFNATVLDIKDNPKNIKFQEVAAEMVARTIDDVDAAIVNGNYAMEAGLNISDAIATESADSESAQTYANIIAVKKGNENEYAIKALIAELTSDQTRDFINDTYKGAVVPIF